MDLYTRLEISLLVECIPSGRARRIFGFDDTCRHVSHWLLIHHTGLHSVTVHELIKGTQLDKIISNIILRGIGGRPSNKMCRKLFRAML